MHPALRPYVRSMVPYHERLATDVAHIGVPSPSSTVIIAFDEPLDVGWLATPQEHAQHWAAVAGLHLGPALIRTHGLQHGIQLAVTPLGARTLFGVPIGALMGIVAPMAELPRGLDESMHAWIASGADDGERVKRLEGALVRRVETAAERAVRPELRQAWEVLAASAGTVRVGQLADEVGWSRRHLVNRFTSEFGVGPKEAARLFRLERSHALLRSRTPLADIAAKAGFADQAHFTREWRAMTGQTPSRSRESTYSNLQDLIVASGRH